jgi:prephenate dehydrogenase
MIDQLCVIGVGLIGGSVAKAAKLRGVARQIVGVDCDKDNLARALKSNVVDLTALDPAAGARQSDFVLIATPVGATESIVDQLRCVWSEATVYTDVGSTKNNVVEAVNRIFGYMPANFVPAHPIAGAERTGVEASTPDLFEGKRIIVTPATSTSTDAVSRVETFWRALGGKVSQMTCEHHDQVLGATSHLPHVLAFALTAMLGQKDQQQEIFQYAAGGFRDFTRIASSDPKMWLDICLANRKALVPLIEQYRDVLHSVAALIEAQSGEELYALFEEARDARQRFLDL